MNNLDEFKKKPQANQFDALSVYIKLNGGYQKYPNTVIV